MPPAATTDGLKRCTLCLLEKPLEAFPKRYDRPGVQSRCKDCARQLYKKWIKSNPEKRQVYDRRSSLKQKFGLDPDLYDAMLFAQDGCCAICRKLSAECRRRLDVDHNHTTNKVRGLLCEDCNKMVGLAHEQTEILTRAAEYLTRFERKKQ